MQTECKTGALLASLLDRPKPAGSPEGWWTRDARRHNRSIVAATTSDEAGFTQAMGTALIAEQFSARTTKGSIAMTYNQRPPLRGTDKGGISMVAVAIAAIVVIGLIYMMFGGDRTTVVRDGVSPPNVTVQTPAPSAPVIVTPNSSNTGAGSGTPNAPGTGQR